MHEVLVNRLGGLSLPRKSVVRLTDRPDMTLDVYRERKQQCNNNMHHWTSAVASALSNRQNCWLDVGCFGFNGPLRQYFSLYRAISQREGERGEKRTDESQKMSKQPPTTPTTSAVGPCPTVIQIVGRPSTGSLPSTIAPPDHPGKNVHVHANTLHTWRGRTHGAGYARHGSVPLSHSENVVTRIG